MIGQDLAYQGEATHAGGIESKGINNNIGYEMIEGIDGGQVRTRSDWLAYLKWFENAKQVAEEKKTTKLDKITHAYSYGQAENTIKSLAFPSIMKHHLFNIET